MTELPGVGVGMDVERVDRFAARLDNYTGGRFRPPFSKAEHEWCRAHRNPAAAYAMCWCGKEAAVKALWRWAQLEPRRITLEHLPDLGPPRLIILDPPATLHGVDTKVSLSVTRTTAAAIVVAFESRA